MNLALSYNHINKLDYNILNNQKAYSKISFGNNKQQDLYLNSNIKTVKSDEFDRLTGIEFRNPINIYNAIVSLADSKNEYISAELLRKLHTQESLIDLSLGLKFSKDLENVKVKSLIGMGAYSLAFETSNGDVIKLTDIEHFPHGRKPASFDLPIKASGKFKGVYGNYYYYIEEKVSQKDITQDELRQIVKQIKRLGYKMKDYLVHYSEDEDPFKEIIKSEQFGRAKNGKIYLIDPGCAIETDKVYKNGSNNSFKRFLKYLMK